MRNELACVMSEIWAATKRSIGFICHSLCKSCSWHRTEIYDNV